MVTPIAPASNLSAIALYGLPPDGVGSFESWLTGQQVQRTLNKSAEHFREQGRQAEADFDDRRRQQRIELAREQDFIRAQQRQQMLRPNFTSQEELQKQVQWLASSL